MLSISSSLASEPGPSDVILPSSPRLKEILGLKRLDPSTDKLISVVAPGGVLVKYGLEYDAEVRALQFVHGRLSVRTPRILQHRSLELEGRRLVFLHGRMPRCASC